MGVGDILAALGRRWYVLVAGLLLTVGIGLYVYQDTPPDYTARSLTLLLPPAGVGEEAGSNPFLELGGLELTSRVLAATYSGTEFQNDIAKRFPDAEVVVSIEESTQGGVIAVDVQNDGEETTMKLLDEVTSTVPQRLEQLQTEAGVADQDAVRTLLLASDTEATPDFQSVIRTLVIAVAGGIAVTVVLALLLDLLLAHLRRRKSGVNVRRSRHERRERSGRPAPGVDVETDGSALVASAPPSSADGVEHGSRSRSLRTSRPVEARSAAPGLSPLDKRDSS